MGSLDFRWPTDQGLWSIGSLMKAWNLNCHVTECETYPSHYLLFICFQWLVLMFISRKFCPHEECNSDNTCLNSTHCCNYRWLTLQSNDKTFLLCLSGYLRDLCQYLTQIFQIQIPLSLLYAVLYLLFIICISLVKFCIMHVHNKPEL